MQLFIYCSWNSVHIPPPVYSFTSIFLLMFFLGRVNSTWWMIRDVQASTSWYCTFIKFLVFFLQGVGKRCLHPSLPLERVFCESRGSSSLITSLLSHSGPLAIAFAVHTGGCAEPWGPPVATDAGDILRCFWKCFSSYLRAVHLYSQTSAVLQSAGSLVKPQLFLGCTWRGQFSVRWSLGICISNKFVGAVADAAGPANMLLEPPGVLAATGI